MPTHKLLIAPIVAMLIPAAIGCDKNENQRLAEMAEKQLIRQAEQNRRMSDLQGEVAAGAHRLGDANAETRQEMIAMQREIQAERVEVCRQRNRLDDDRRNLASQHRRDPLIAAAITNTGFLLACLLPLVLCWHLLCRRVEAADDRMVAEVLLEDMVATRPWSLPHADTNRSIGLRANHGAERLSDDQSSADESPMTS